MANTLNLGTDGNWATKKDSLLAYNDENNNFKPLPFEFERASSATVVNKDGLIETVGNDIPRIDFSDDANGSLLLEPQRTNLLTYSEDFSNAAWSPNSNALISLSSNLSPDGTANAYRVEAVTGTQVGHVGTTTIGTTITHSIWVRRISGSTTFNMVDVNNINTSVNITSDWQRFSLTSTATSVNLRSYFKTAALGDVVEIYGAQVEQGSYPTSYIPTQGSAVTRLADACTNGGNEQVINSTEGTVFLDFKPQTLDETSRYLSIENSSSISNGWMGVFASLVSGDIRFRFYGGGWDINSSVIIEKGTRYKIAFSYKDGVQTSIYVNGNLINNITASLSGKSYQKIRLSEAAIGVRGDADFKDVRLYNTALTDSELQQLTTI